MPPKKRKTDLVSKKVGVPYSEYARPNRMKLSDVIRYCRPKDKSCSGIYGKIFGHNFIPMPLSLPGFYVKKRKCIIVCQRCGAVAK